MSFIGEERISIRIPMPQSAERKDAEDRIEGKRTAVSLQSHVDEVRRGPAQVEAARGD